MKIRAICLLLCKLPSNLQFVQLNHGLSHNNTSTIIWKRCIADMWWKWNTNTKAIITYIIMSGVQNTNWENWGQINGHEDYILHSLVRLSAYTEKAYSAHISWQNIHRTTKLLKLLQECLGQLDTARIRGRNRPLMSGYGLHGKLQIARL